MSSEDNLLFLEAVFTNLNIYNDVFFVWSCNSLVDGCPGCPGECLLNNFSIIYYISLFVLS